MEAWYRLAGEEGAFCFLLLLVLDCSILILRFNLLIPFHPSFILLRYCLFEPKVKLGRNDNGDLIVVSSAPCFPLPHSVCCGGGIRARCFDQFAISFTRIQNSHVEQRTEYLDMGL